MYAVFDLGGSLDYVALRKPQWHEVVLVSIMVVMFGLLSGRALSIMIDGGVCAGVVFVG